MKEFHRKQRGCYRVGVKEKVLNTCTYIYFAMATKCITITVEAYGRLASQKQERESFSDVINRITPRKSSLLDLVGLLSSKEAEDMKKHIAEGRKRTEERMNKIAELMR